MEVRHAAHLTVGVREQGEQASQLVLDDVRVQHLHSRLAHVDQRVSHPGGPVVCVLFLSEQQLLGRALQALLTARLPRAVRVACGRNSMTIWLPNDQMEL